MSDGEEGGAGGQIGLTNNNLPMGVDPNGGVFYAYSADDIYCFAEVPVYTGLSTNTLEGIVPSGFAANSDGDFRGRQ